MMVRPAELQTLGTRRLPITRAWVPLAVLLIVLGSLIFLLENDVIRDAVRAIFGGAV